MNEEYYLIKEASAKIGVEAHVLRYWEEELKMQIHRNEMGHRYYTERDVEIFTKVRDLKEKGLQLKAIRRYLDIRRQQIANGEACNPVDVLQLVSSDEPVEQDMEYGRETGEDRKDTASGKDMLTEAKDTVPKQGTAAEGTVSKKDTVAANEDAVLKKDTVAADEDTVSKKGTAAEVKETVQKEAPVTGKKNAARKKETGAGSGSTVHKKETGKDKSHTKKETGAENTDTVQQNETIVKGAMQNEETVAESRELVQKETASMIPVRQTIFSNEEKLEQFQQIMNRILANAIRENNELIEQSAGEHAASAVVTQIQGMTKEQEARAEARYQKLDQTLREIQRARMEAAAANMRPVDRRKQKRLKRKNGAAPHADVAEQSQ